MTSRLIASAALAALLLGGSAQAEPPLKSGPPVGAENNRGGLRPTFVAGAGASQRLCPV